MRSLWRILALQWLGGDGSEALTGDSAILEGLLYGGNARPVRAFDVRRDPQVSRHAILATNPERRSGPETAAEGALRPGATGRYSR